MLSEVLRMLGILFIALSSLMFTPFMWSRCRNNSLAGTIFTFEVGQYVQTVGIGKHQSSHLGLKYC